MLNEYFADGNIIIPPSIKRNFIVKKFTTLYVIIFSLFMQGCAAITTQSLPVIKVVKIADTKKNTLYVRVNNWMVDTFKNAESVIQFSDKEAGVISGRYLLGTVSRASQYGAANYAYASIKVIVKDNASKITVIPESFTYAQGNMYTLYTEKEVKRDVDYLIASFDKAMNEVESSDW